MKVKAFMVFVMLVFVMLLIYGLFMLCRDINNDFKLYDKYSNPEEMQGIWKIESDDKNYSHKNNQYFVLYHNNSFEYYFNGLPYIMESFFGTKKYNRPDGNAFYEYENLSPIKGNWTIQKEETGEKLIVFDFIFLNKKYESSYILSLSRRTKRIVINFGFSQDYNDGKAPIKFQRSDTLNYRYYNPNLGKWIKRDIIEEMNNENMYAMVGNNPIIFGDILGLFKNTDYYKRKIR